MVSASPDVLMNSGPGAQKQSRQTIYSNQTSKLQSLFDQSNPQNMSLGTHLKLIYCEHSYESYVVMAIHAHERSHVSVAGQPKEAVEKKDREAQRSRWMKHITAGFRMYYELHPVEQFYHILLAIAKFKEHSLSFVSSEYINILTIPFPVISCPYK